MSWVKSNMGVIITQLVGVALMGAIALAAGNSLDGYVRKEDWQTRNAAIDARFDKLDISIRDQLKSIQDSIIAAGVQYVSQSRWSDRNLVIDDRFEKLEKYVTEGRVERMMFQRDVIDRLARMEVMLEEHIKAEVREKLLGKEK